MNWDSIIDVLMEEIKDDALRAIIYKKILEVSDSYSDGEESLGLDDVFDDVMDSFVEEDEEEDEDEEMDDMSDGYDYED